MYSVAVLSEEHQLGTKLPKIGHSAQAQVQGQDQMVFPTLHNFFYI